LNNFVIDFDGRVYIRTEVIFSFSHLNKFIHRNVHAVSIQNLASAKTRKKQNILTAFLHAIYKRHFLLRTRCEETLEKKSMKLLPEEFKHLSIHGTEIYDLLIRDEDESRRRLFMNKDMVSFRLPQSLQPGYDGNSFSCECEDLDSPMMPLLRCLGPAKTVRVLGSMLCEVRLIFVSKYVDTLSSCVRAAMAFLSQGLLVWRHVSITVLPPHLFRFLSAGAPYVVGVLERYADKIDRVRGLKDVLSINLDTGALKVYNMNEPKKIIPDLLEAPKSTRKQKNKFMGIEMLVKDFTEIIEADQKLWSSSLLPSIGPEASEIITNNKNFEKSVSDRDMLSGNRKGKDDFFETAEQFVKSMKVSAKDVTDAKVTSATVELNTKPPGATGSVRKDMAARPITKRPFTVCNNDQGEELMRASLICFFLELYGDIGMYLLASKTTGRALKVDKKKFLVRKTQMGVPEKSPLWMVLKQFSRSIMFERFVNGSIEDSEKHKKTKSLLDHIPIFSLCQRHLRKSKSEFTTVDIRRVVFTTIEGCPFHKFVERQENVRERALALTSNSAFEGDEVGEIKKLIQECRESSSSHTQVVAVCWMRVGETRSAYWKHNLLGLNLFKTLVIHGPIAVISALTDGTAMIYALRYYVNKNIEAEKSIQLSARQLFYLINNIPVMMCRRRKALASDVLNQKSIDESVVWSNYLIRRLPRNVGFKHIHVMFSPSDNAVPKSSSKEGRRTFVPEVEKVNSIPVRSTKLPEVSGLKAIPTRRLSNQADAGQMTMENRPQAHGQRDQPRQRHSMYRPNVDPSQFNQPGRVQDTEPSNRRDSDRDASNIPRSRNVQAQNGSMNYERHQGAARIGHGQDSGGLDQGRRKHIRQLIDRHAGEKKNNVLLNTSNPLSRNARVPSHNDFQDRR